MIVFDECLPQYLPAFLNRARGRQEAIGLREILGPKVADVCWLALAGERGWDAITADLFGGHREAIERVAARQHGVRVVVVPHRIRKLGSWRICTSIINSWSEIMTSLPRAAPGTRFEINMNGKLKRLRS